MYGFDGIFGFTKMVFKLGALLKISSGGFENIYTHSIIAVNKIITSRPTSNSV